MREFEDGGPAFPGMRSYPLNPESHFYGMSLRDWFAGMASDKTVELSAAGYMEKHNVKTCTQSEARYFYADEMLQARGDKK